MKKILAIIIGLSLLIAAAAFARPWGAGQGAGISAEQQKFFAETRDLRKEMHDKRFQLMELYRSNADQTKIDAVEADMEAIRAQIQAKAAELGITAGPGSCGGPGGNCRNGQGRSFEQGSCNGGPCGNQMAGGCGMRGRCGN